MAWCRIKLRDADSRASEYAKSRLPSRVPNIHNTKKTKYLEIQLERNPEIFPSHVFNIQTQYFNVRQRITIIQQYHVYQTWWNLRFYKYEY